MVPSFKIKILVFSCSLIFLYISIVLILFLADFITNPLIFLRANVHRTSDAISQTISGHSKFSTESFSFEDTIKTNDEIKELSLEIDNTFSLIKGIVPYISFSTLKNADKGSSSSRSSPSKSGRTSRMPSTRTATPTERSSLTTPSIPANSSRSTTAVQSTNCRSHTRPITITQPTSMRLGTRPLPRTTTSS